MTLQQIITELNKHFKANATVGKDTTTIHATRGSESAYIAFKHQDLNQHPDYYIDEFRSLLQ